MKKLRAAVALVLGVGLAFAAANTLTAARRVEPPTPEVSVDGKVSAGEAASAQRIVEQSDIGRVLLRDHDATIGKWEPAMIEGEGRGASTLLTLGVPTRMAPDVLRPSTPEAEQRALDAEREASEGASDLELPAAVPVDPDDYLVISEALIEEVVVEYIVVVDIPTQRIVLMEPNPAPPVLTEDVAAAQREDRGLRPPPPPAESIPLTEVNRFHEEDEEAADD